MHVVFSKHQKLYWLLVLLYSWYIVLRISYEWLPFYSVTLWSLSFFKEHTRSQTAFWDMTGADKNGPDLCLHTPLKSISALHSLGVIFRMASTAGWQSVAGLLTTWPPFIVILLPGSVAPSDLESSGWSLTLAPCLSTVSDHPVTMDWLHSLSISRSPHWFWSFYTWT